MSSTTTYKRLTEFPRAFCDDGLANPPARISDGNAVAKEACNVLTKPLPRANVSTSTLPCRSPWRAPRPQLGGRVAFRPSCGLSLRCRLAWPLPPAARRLRHEQKRPSAPCSPWVGESNGSALETAVKHYEWSNAILAVSDVKPRGRSWWGRVKHPQILLGVVREHAPGATGLAPLRAAPRRAVLRRPVWAAPRHSAPQI